MALVQQTPSQVGTHMASMTAAALATLIAAYRGGSKIALGQIVKGHLPLVAFVARKMRKRIAAQGWGMDDACSAGNIGLLKAIEAFDPGRGVTFSSFAVDHIRAAIQTDLRLPRKIHGSIAVNSNYSRCATDQGVHEMPADRALQTMEHARKAQAIARLEIPFGDSLAGREQAIWWEKVMLDCREAKPSDYGCNSAARVSQIRSGLINRFRALAVNA